MIRTFRLIFYIFLTLTTVFEWCYYQGEAKGDDCLNVKSYFWKHLGTKTAYRYVANYNDSKINFNGCTPKKIWVIVRHGTRYAKKSLIDRMHTRLTGIRDAVKSTIKNKGTLCEVHAFNISEWTPQMDAAEQKRLSHEGENEMIELAERFQNRFPEILGADYSNSSFEFRATETQRTIRSKYYFTVGLFGRKVANHVWSPEPIYKDPVLRFYKLCNKWIKDVKKNQKASLEVQKFKSSDIAKQVLKNVAVRLGYEELLFEDVELMYNTCGYESSLNRYAFSPWCTVFSEDDMRVMEFARELTYYWASGYGHDINFQQACPLMEDFLHHVQSEGGPDATFYFTHSGTLLKFLSHLGLYYDEFKLTHEKFDHSRLWKVSYIDAFASNLAFITFQCGEQQKLLTLHQERPVKLPGCPKEGLCSFEKVLKYCIGPEPELEHTTAAEGASAQTMPTDPDNVSLLAIRTEVSSCEITQDAPLKVGKNENIPKIKNIKTSNPLQDAENKKVTAGATVEIDEAEDRQRTGRYLAVGVTLVMVFIAFYHTVLRHATVLAGLLAPAIIMLLYILWLLYFAKKRKTQISEVPSEIPQVKRIRGQRKSGNPGVNIDVVDMTNSYRKRTKMQYK